MSDLKLPLQIAAGIFIGIFSIILLIAMGRYIYYKNVVEPALQNLSDQFEAAAEMSRRDPVRRTSSRRSAPYITTEIVPPQSLEKCMEITGGVMTNDTIRCRNGYKATIRHYPAENRIEVIKTEPLQDYYEIERAEEDQQ